MCTRRFVVDHVSLAAAARRMLLRSNKIITTVHVMWRVRRYLGKTIIDAAATSEETQRLGSRKSPMMTMAVYLFIYYRAFPSEVYYPFRRPEKCAHHRGLKAAQFALLFIYLFKRRLII